MRDFASEPIWIIALVIVLGVVPLVLIVTRRLSSIFFHHPRSEDAPPLSDMLIDGTSFAPRFKKADESERNVRIRSVSHR